jgi:REP element-mobilizing transposase RayT
MPRALRVEYPGALYHVMDRGDRQEDIFLDDVDRQDFVKTLAEACQKTGWQTHAYCLMRNHFHLVLETPNPNLVQLELMDGKLGENHSGQLHWETAEQKANRIISQELARLGWTEADLAARLKSDPGKLSIAARVRTETTLSIKWIAARLQLGTTKSANAMLHHWIQTHEKPQKTTSSAQLQFQPMV